jgi:hypothetical protein
VMLAKAESLIQGYDSPLSHHQENYK